MSTCDDARTPAELLAEEFRDRMRRGEQDSWRENGPRRDPGTMDLVEIGESRT